MNEKLHEVCLDFKYVISWCVLAIVCVEVAYKLPSVFKDPIVYPIIVLLYTVATISALNSVLNIHVYVQVLLFGVAYNATVIIANTGDKDLELQIENARYSIHLFPTNLKVYRQGKQLNIKMYKDVILFV